MTVEEASAIIDQLCDKLGLAVSSMSELVPELTRVKVSGCIYAILVCMLLSSAAAIFIFIKYKNTVKLVEDASDSDQAYYRIKMSDDCGWIITLIVGISVVGVCVMWIIITGYELLQWVTSPTMMTIQYILDLMCGGV